MSTYDYDENLPYVALTEGNELEARFRFRFEADLYVGSHPYLRVIDTTPKPRVPEDARYVTFQNAEGYDRYAKRDNAGVWHLDDGDYEADLEDFYDVTPDTVFTVLDERKA